MTLYNYKLLNEQEQAEDLWDKGVHLGERTDGEHRILLYQINGFYVEVFYHMGYDTIKRLHSFKNTDQYANHTLKRHHLGFLINLFNYIYQFYVFWDITT